MNPVVHFEMPAENRERMAKFYTKAFGWQTQMLGEEMGGYVVVTTTESDDNGPKKPGAINGGFFKKTADTVSHYPSVVISVDDHCRRNQKGSERRGESARRTDGHPGRRTVRRVPGYRGESRVDAAAVAANEHAAEVTLAAIDVFSICDGLQLVRGGS